MYLPHQQNAERHTHRVNDEVYTIWNKKLKMVIAETVRRLRPE
jgi:hypothetical protein